MFPAVEAKLIDLILNAAAADIFQILKSAQFHQKYSKSEDWLCPVMLVQKASAWLSRYSVYKKFADAVTAEEVETFFLIEFICEYGDLIEYICTREAWLVRLTMKVEELRCAEEGM